MAINPPSLFGPFLRICHDFPGVIILYMDLHPLYLEGTELDDWAVNNDPDPALYYKTAMEAQIQKLEAISVILPDFANAGVPPRVVGHHISKSVKLPVTCFMFSLEGFEAFAFIRDNFHDIKVVVVSDVPVHIPYSVVHIEWTQEHYDSELKSFSEYLSDETLGPEDARKRKDLIASGTDDWYKQWSSGTILRKEGHIYRAGSHQSHYCEGIRELGLEESVFKPYEAGDKAFVCEVYSYSTVATILECIISSLDMAESLEQE